MLKYCPWQVIETVDKMMKWGTVQTMLMMKVFTKPVRIGNVGTKQIM